MNALEVLVVDDDPNNVDVAALVLTRGGHRVMATFNGRDALDLCLNQGRHFDLILMDVAMPYTDGLEAIRCLRAAAPTREVPIVCVSAKASGATEAQALAAGADCFLSKPYRRKQLLKAIDETLRRRGLLLEGESIGGADR